jgi:hypothetical protein
VAPVDSNFILNDSKCSAILPIDADSSADCCREQEPNPRPEPEMIKQLKEKLSNVDEKSNANCIQIPTVESVQQPCTPVNSLKTNYLKEEQAPLAQEENEQSFTGLNVTTENRINVDEAKCVEQLVMDKLAINDETADAKPKETAEKLTVPPANDEEFQRVDENCLEGDDQYQSDVSFDDYPVIDLNQENEQAEEPKVLETIQVLDDVLNAQYETEPSSTRIKHCFQYENPNEEVVINDCQIAGSFNNWSENLVLENDETNKRIWFLNTDLDPGIHEYKFIVNGEWICDSTKPMKNENNFVTLFSN